MVEQRSRVVCTAIPPRPADQALFEPLERRALLASDAVLDWNETLLDAVRRDHTAPPYAARNMAVVHAAVFDAANAIDGGHAPYAVRRRGPRGASAEAAVAAAAHRTLAALYPGQKAMFDAALAESLAGVPDGRAERKGVALGRSVAGRILAQRRNDGADAEVSYQPGADPHDWQPTPPDHRPALLPNWPDVEPFVITSAEQFRPAGPPDMASAAYASALAEVRELGAADSRARTAEQTEIAYFWADGAGTATPPGHWNEIAQGVAAAEGNTLVENARLFALLNVALADAGIAAWDAKYVFNVCRPITGIRDADTDPNPATEADAQWTPLLATPPFPAYTSGHSTFSAAAATVLANFFGTDRVAFTTTSDAVPGVTRSFTSFSQAAEEAGASRIYGGIHWNFDNADGLALGRAVGGFVSEHLLRPVSSRPHSAPRPMHARRLATDLRLGMRHDMPPFSRVPGGYDAARPGEERAEHFAPSFLDAAHEDPRRA